MGFAQGLLCLLALGDIMVGTYYGVHSAVFSQQRFGVNQHPYRLVRAWVPHGNQLVYHGLTGDCCFPHGVIIDVEEFSIFSAYLPLTPVLAVNVQNIGFATEAEYAQEFRINDRKFARLVDQRNSRCYIVYECPELFFVPADGVNDFLISSSAFLRSVMSRRNATPCVRSSFVVAAPMMIGMRLPSLRMNSFS